MSGPRRDAVDSSTADRRTVWFVRIGYLTGLIGFGLVIIGLGTAFELLVTQSEPVGVSTALSVRAHYSIAGIVLLATGFGFRRIASTR